VGQGRTRYTSKEASKGAAIFNTGVPIAGNGGIIRIVSEYCEDVTRSKAERDCQYFMVEKYKQEGGLLNGNSPSAKFTNFYGTVYDNWNNFPHHTNLPGSPSDTTAATDAANRTNPSRPHVDIPANVLQLPEIIQLIYTTGNKFFRVGAAVNLAWQFGVLPIVSDLDKIRSFADQLDRRMKILDRLQGENGYRKTTKHGGFAVDGWYNKVIQSQGVFISKPFHCITREIVKCHTRWIPQGNFRSLNTHAKRVLASDALNGFVSSNAIGIDLYSVWQAIPWTWLIDWATNASSYFLATRNIVPASLDGVYVMRTTQSVYTERGGTVAGVQHAPVTIIRTNKYRKKGLVAPYAQFPLLSANQMGILASLAITKGR
jgi:hypothetical protein